MTFNLAGVRKAVAGLVTPALAFVVLHLGLDLDPSLTAAIAAALTGIVVHAIPNSVKV